MNIELRPLDMEKSKLNLSIEEELTKCVEEDREFIKGVLERDIDNAIEEFWDSVQTKLNVLSMMGIPMYKIHSGLDKHGDKMNSRGYIFKE